MQLSSAQALENDLEALQHLSCIDAAVEYSNLRRNSTLNIYTWWQSQIISGKKCCTLEWATITFYKETKTHNLKQPHRKIIQGRN